MNICRSLFDPATDRVDVCLSGQGDLHDMLWKVFLQCIAHLIGSQVGSACFFNLHDVSDNVMSQVRTAFRKMQVHIQIISAHECFQDPLDIIHTALDNRVTSVQQLARKVRFVFIRPRSTCSAAALTSTSIMD